MFQKKRHKNIKVLLISGSFFFREFQRIVLIVILAELLYVVNERTAAGASAVAYIKSALIAD